MNLSPSADERSAVRAATLAAALLIAQQVAARAARDTLFLSAYQVRSLPFAMIASSLVALAGAETLAMTLARRAPSRTVPAAALGSALLLLAIFLLSAGSPRAAALLLYLHVAAFGAALVSGFWSLVNERFDPYTARRAVGRIGVGATAGGLAGAAAAWTASRVIPVSGILLVLVALHALAALALRRAAGRARPLANARASPRFALPAIVRTPYLRRLALVVVAGAAVEAILDFAFKAEAARRFDSGAALLGGFAIFHGAVSVTSLLLQAAAARPALQHLGIAGTVSLRPLFTALGSLLGVASPRLAAAAFTRGAHESLTNSLFRSGYELLYTPLAESEKRRVKAVLDVSMDKAGTLLGSAFVLAILAWAPDGSPRALFAAALLLSLVAFDLSRRLHRGYVRTLERSLLDGRVRLDPNDYVDQATQLTLAQTSLIERSALLRQIEELRTTLPPEGAAVPPTLPPDEPLPAPAAAADDSLLETVRGLRSRDLQVLRRVVEQHPEPEPLLVSALIPLLASDQAFAHVVAALRRVCARSTGQLLDALLDPNADAVVRQRIPRVLKSCATPRAVAGLVAALDDASFAVRAAAASALAALHERSSAVRLARHAVLERVRRELDSGEPVDRQLPQLFALLSLVLEQEPLRIAWAALRGGDLAPGDRSLQGTALEYLNNVLPEDVFRRLVSLFGASSYAPAAARRRSVDQVKDELRSSSVNLHVADLPWREGES